MTGCSGHFFFNQMNLVFRQREISMIDINAFDKEIGLTLVEPSNNIKVGFGNSKIIRLGVIPREKSLEAVKLLHDVCAKTRETGGQRPLNQKKVEKYADAIRNGEFPFVRMTFAYDRKKKELKSVDGQHSTEALLIAGVEVPIIISVIECESQQELTKLFNAFDRKGSQRVKTDLIAIHFKNNKGYEEVPYFAISHAVSAGQAIDPKADGRFSKGGIVNNNVAHEAIRVVAVRDNPEWLKLTKEYAMAVGGTHEQTKKMIRAGARIAMFQIIYFYGKIGQTFVQKFFESFYRFSDTGKHNFVFAEKYDKIRNRAAGGGSYRSLEAYNMLMWSFLSHIKVINGDFDNTMNYFVSGKTIENRPYNK
jgi:hypothetical protein